MQIFTFFRSLGGLIAALWNGNIGFDANGNALFNGDVVICGDASIQGNAQIEGWTQTNYDVSVNGHLTAAGKITSETDVVCYPSNGDGV